MAALTGMTPFPESILRDYHWLDACLMGQVGTEKEFKATWQAYRYTIDKKMYAYIGVHDPTGRPIVVFKLEPALSEMLRRQYEDIEPGYYMTKLNWSTVFLDGSVPQEILIELAGSSHDLVFSSLSKKAQKEIAGES